MNSTERFLEGKQWAGQANCDELSQTEFDRIFYPNVEGRAAARVGQEARQICEGCPVQAECLDSAIEDNDIFLGVRGGLRPVQLLQEKRKRNETKPKKTHRTPKGISKGNY